MSKNVIFCCKIYHSKPGGGKELAGHVNFGAELSRRSDSINVIEGILTQVSNRFGCDKKDIYIENMITL